ncbi:MAG: hypothetical protein LH629_04160 [Ignavibacteria bacterium]|nr:hypothetical protein [Ignavibacteria bacterium]
MNHLSDTGKSEDSLLLKCLRLFDCYTSVINASEIFSGCNGKVQTDSAKSSFYGTGVLGIPYKYSFTIAKVLKSIDKFKLENSYRDAVLVSICMETKLPFLTLNEKNYKEIFRINKVKFINKDLILQNNSPEIIFKKAKIL